MSLTIALQNTSDTDQSITLFDSGALGTASFIEVNSSFTAQSVIISAPSGAPSSQQVTNDGKTYYDAVFNPTTGYYFGSFGTTIGFSATINGSSYSYLTIIPSVANRTFDDIQTFLTNILRNDGTNPRPNAQVVLNVTQSDGINYLNCLVLDTIQSNESVIYNSCLIYYNTTELGVGGSSANEIFYDQAYTEAIIDNTFLLANYPNTTYADSEGWITFQGNSMSTPAFVWFRMYDTYLQSVSFNSSYSYQFEFQLTEVLVGANFVLLNSPSGTNICTISGNSTAVQTFSGLVPNATRLVLVSDNVASPDWNGQIKMRVRPMTGVSSPKGNTSLSLLSQLNNGGAYLSSNPNIIGKVAVTGVGLQEILNSTTGNSYKVTSLYIWSENPTQLTQSITYGVKNSNGNLEQTELDVVIDPFAQNQVTYRTNGMDDFEIDSNSFIQFTLKAQSAVNMKFEYVKNSYDEIKLIQMGLGKLLGLEEEVKEDIDKSLIDDFDTFYAQQ
jgi:hypothetical protein